MQYNASIKSAILKILHDVENTHDMILRNKTKKQKQKSSY